ncbi:MAG: branched-chain amino acid ABC transporter permease [Chloroflexi bacterium]|nr:branched-chain amino acid ABC transporter permease [Chloroflexota bacterium]
MIVALAAGFLYRLLALILSNPAYFFEQVRNGLQLGFVYALIALGYTMVYGVVRLINFAHGDVFMVGAFTSFYAITRYGWGFLPAILLSMIICAVLAITIERVAYKPLRDAPRISALITAVGMSFFLEYFSALDFVFTPDYITYKRPFEVRVWEVGGVTISNIMIIIVVAAVLLLAFLQYVVRQTKIGKAMRATAADKPTARLMGINIDLVISATFGLGALFAGAAGVLYAIAYPQIITFVGILPGLKAFVAAVLGGIGSIPGAFLGSLIMGQVEVLTTAFFSVPLPSGEVLRGSTIRDLIAMAVLILIFLVRPRGLLGEPEAEKA